MDKATLFELQWRDWLLWPLARPLGFVYEYIGHPLIEAFSHTFLIGTKPLGLPRFVRKAFKPRFLKKEIFTLANLVTLYGLFLFGQLLYMMAALLWGKEEASIYSLTAYFLGLESPDLWAISWLALEIFVTDMIDGPLARLNHAVTALGTLLDHVRDYLTGICATLFLIIVTLVSHDWYFVILETASFAGTLGVVVWYFYFLQHAYKQASFPPPLGIRLWMKSRIQFMRVVWLEKDQTSLPGRIQFVSIACLISTGLFYYATHSSFFSVVFHIALIVSLAATFYFLYELWVLRRERIGLSR